MSAFRNHKGLTATLAILLLIAIGAVVYVAVVRPSGASKTKTSSQVHHPIIKSPSEVKSGTKVPGTVTSTSATPPSNATSGPAPKASH